MRGAISDGVHIAKTFAQAGVLRPSRPDRALRAVQALRRWGPTLASGYMGAAALYPDAAGILDERGMLTFEQIERRTNALARGLAGYGLREGDRVAIMCRNHRGFIETSIACSKLGVHAIYLNTSFAGPQVSDGGRQRGAPARSSTTRSSPSWCAKPPPAAWGSWPGATTRSQPSTRSSMS